MAAFGFTPFPRIAFAVTVIMIWPVMGERSEALTEMRSTLLRRSRVKPTRFGGESLVLPQLTVGSSGRCAACSGPLDPGVSRLGLGF